MSIQSLKIILVLIISISFAISSFADSTEPEVALSDYDTSYLSKEPGLSWANDPFLKKPGFMVKDVDQDELKLEAVIWDHDSPRAVVNGVGVAKGDRIMRKKVIKIGENYVVLEEDDSLLELTLPIKLPSNTAEPLISIEEVSK